MLLMNLIPAVKREPEPASIDLHPFFWNLLGISGPGGNPVVGRIADRDFATQAVFLTLLSRSYAAYMMAAALAFRRVAELTTDPVARAAALAAFDAEMGRESDPREGSISRLEGFRHTME